MTYLSSLVEVGKCGSLPLINIFVISGFYLTLALAR
jgi:hypothetical protein